MRKLIVEEWISLDGYAADKNNSTDFFRDISPQQKNRAEQDQLKFMQSVDAILLGRKTYELFSSFWPAVSGKEELMATPINHTKKLIFSNSVSEAQWGTYDNAEIITGDAVQRIKEFKETDGGNMILWGSISLAQALLKSNLVDELHVTICPVLLGAGLPLFPGADDFRQFELTELRNYNTGYVFFNYRPVSQ